MKAIVTIAGVSRGETGDTIRFTDEAPGVLQPAPGVRSARWEPVHGRLTIESDGVQIAEVLGELRRVDAWEVDRDTGEVSSRASIAFACDGRLHADEIAGLFKAESLKLSFKAAQGQLPFGEADARQDKGGKAAARAKQEV